MMALWTVASSVPSVFRRLVSPASPARAMCTTTVTSITSQQSEFEQTAAPDGVIDMRLGQPSPRLLPLDMVREASLHRFAAGSGNHQLLQYGNPVGYASYRKSLAAFLTRHLSVGIDPDELMATSGNSLALGMVCTALKQSHQDTTGQGTYVAIVEQPTYFLAGSIFKSSGVPCVGAQCDSEGIIVRGDAGLEGAVARSMAVHGVQPSMIYTIPIFQNPLGVTMSRARAEDLVSYAEEHGMVIIADEPYPLLQYESGGAGGKQLKTLMELDRGRGIIASLGSYSKILSPGLRCGWIHAAPSWIEKIVAHGTIQSGGCLSPVTSGMAHSAIDLGLLDNHLAELKVIHGSRRKALADAIAEHMPGATMPYCSSPSGGYFMWVTLPESCPQDAKELLSAATAAGVAFQPGLFCCAAPLSGGPRAERILARSFRLSFAFYEEDELVEGVKRLVAAIDAATAASGDNGGGGGGGGGGRSASNQETGDGLSTDADASGGGGGGTSTSTSSGSISLREQFLAELASLEAEAPPLKGKAREAEDADVGFQKRMADQEKRLLEAFAATDASQ